MKQQLMLLVFLLLGCRIQAQEHAFDLLAGLVYPTISGEQVGKAKPKMGLTFGVLYRKKNAKQDMWSLGLEYQLLQRTYKVQVNNREETANERFELFQIGYDPIYWFLDKKKQGYVGLGIFLDYLLHQEEEINNNLINRTKLLQRTSLGPSVDLGIQLGQSMRKSLIIGLRGNLGVISFGKNPSGSKGIPLKFNTISLYAGLGI